MGSDASHWLKHSSVIYYFQGVKKDEYKQQLAQHRARSGE